MSNKTEIRKIREQMNIGKNKTIIRIGAEYMDTLSEKQLQEKYRFHEDDYVFLVGSEFDGA